MACCAFAVFVISQMCFALERARHLVFGKSSAMFDHPNPTVEWRPNRREAPALSRNVAVTEAQRFWWHRPAVVLTIGVLALGIEVPMLATWLGAAEYHQQHMLRMQQAFEWIAATICRDTTARTAQ